MQTNLYLAYGSNLNLAQMRHRCPGARVVGYTFLYDRHPVFRGSGSGNYLTLDEGAPACPVGVPCGVFAITRRDRDALDCDEGYPRFYDRVRVALPRVYSLQTHRVVLQDVTALVYLMQPGHPLGCPRTATGRPAGRGMQILAFTSMCCGRHCLTARPDNEKTRSFSAPGLVPCSAPCSPHRTCCFAAPKAGNGFAQLLLVPACLLEKILQPGSGSAQTGGCAGLQVGLGSFLGKDVLALPAAYLALQRALAAVGFLLGQQLAVVGELGGVVVVQHRLRVGGLADTLPVGVPVVAAVCPGKAAYITVADVCQRQVACLPRKADQPALPPAVVGEILPAVAGTRAAVGG